MTSIAAALATCECSLAPIDRGNDDATRKLGLEPLIRKVASGAALDFPRVLDAMIRDRAELSLSCSLGAVHPSQDGRRTGRRPTMFPAGSRMRVGVITYGTSVADTGPRMPILVDKILKAQWPFPPRC